MLEELLRSGFDALGLAVNLYNYVFMEEQDGLSIEAIDRVPIPTGEDNLVYRAARELYAICGAPFRGLRNTLCAAWGKPPSLAGKTSRLTGNPVAVTGNPVSRPVIPASRPVRPASGDGRGIHRRRRHICPCGAER